MSIRNRSARIALLAATTAMAPVISTPALAQNAPVEAKDGGIAEIVVTAQRREESLQKVPLSVVAISGAELRNADIRDPAFGSRRSDCREGWAHAGSGGRYNK